MKNIVILISGEGSNMRAIVQAAKQDGWAAEKGATGGLRGAVRGAVTGEVTGGARVAAVISNRADAKGLEFARCSTGLLKR